MGAGWSADDEQVGHELDDDGDNEMELDSEQVGGDAGGPGPLPLVCLLFLFLFLFFILTCLCFSISVPVSLSLVRVCRRRRLVCLRVDARACRSVRRQAQGLTRAAARREQARMARRSSQPRSTP